MTESAPRLRSDRLIALDVLRGVAVLAMLIAHAMPLVPSARSGLTGSVASNINDLASPLFALVMGMSAALVLARRPAGAGRVILQNLIRGAVLVALGLWLDGWGSWIAVVLQYLGLLLAVGTPLLLLPPRVLAGLAAALALVAGPLNAAVLAAGGPVRPYPPGPADLVTLWLFTGPNYQVTSLLPFFLLGPLLLQHRLRRDRWLAVIAVVAAVTYPVRVLVEQVSGVEFVPGGLPDTLRDIGLVLIAYVAVALLTSWHSAVVDRALLPVRAVGTVALSVYVLQVAVVATFAAAELGYTADTPLAALVLVFGVWGAGVLWWRFVGLGPVEWLTARLTRLVPAG
ncbi:DUF418 domain-containing protein [Rathayibacter iranicus]|uniref:DUF418 domain-containing protein n=2 Tax=Rathayibacter iranicus TaxID=59737 RepID=A0AAD1AGV8_9MICO|nr:DUF418 domain-containing protein [Rathayibacter iranicus]AZZ56364.1 DUF418 domain-containing protein [Rathayibacter iranicus]MWV32194.1 DUF418 domain-containing protein [Rathayibacter iranicus NCPPB 2253 = VKM Ac-1602]PPI45567.1 hypothetical protein C5E09_10065 [Rathayibacter iranicus]PPI59387.1 hypothetical protein C5E08_10990 [Rathayibacter iranicus]PPI70469.1 hypothetical protein C5E01_10035 [Rathayibacter iranicus]